MTESPKHQQSPSEDKPARPKMKMTFHRPIEEVSETLVAMFLAQATHQWMMVHGLIPGSSGPMTGITYPIHIAVEMGGERMCGTIEPSERTETVCVEDAHGPN